MNLDQLKALLNLGWGWMAAGVVLLLLLWEGGKKWLPALVEAAGKRIATVLAGTRIMRTHALRAYREQVGLSAQQLPVIFGDVATSVSTIYVPLQAVGEGAADDAYRQIQKSSHAIVLGPPGAGKSMLLRHIMLMWALGDEGERVPVLLELHRCNGNTASLEQLIVEQCGRDGFVKADRFVERALRTGGLAVLFDGLDEVNAAERDRVAQLLIDFVHAYPACQTVTTCRTAIYDRQLAPEVTTTFHVQEFDERLARRFLRQWPRFDEARLERLMTALRDNPRIMQLARNPLLLTMIAYLYDRGQELPRSRAEFYLEATQELLSRLKDTTNRYRGPVKRAVLKQLALAAQDVPAHEADRRTLPYERVVGEIGTMLPRLNLDAADADGVLREIVDRSGLLLAVDGGERYQFAHLSLQEFLAAEALADNPDGLLARYRAVPDDWRETVKLWCGVVSTDCASVIDAVFQCDPVLAFECLADAQVVDEALADRITDHFKLGWYGWTPPVVLALGSVAADPRPRGRRVYDFLAHVALQGADGQHRKGVLKALAATKLPAAAAVLISSEAYEDLVSMGDLAVPALAESARSGRAQAVDTLHNIGTPSAAQALAGLIWRDDEVARKAAWYLAELATETEIEAALAEVRVDDDVRTCDWVWAPFADPADVRLTPVMGRIAHHLLRAVEPPSLPFIQVDPRLAIPLFSLMLSRAMRIRRKPLSEGARSWRGFGGRSNVADVDQEIRQWLSGMPLAPTHLRLFYALEQRIRIELVVRIASDRLVAERDWIDVRNGDGLFRLSSSVLNLIAYILVTVCGTWVFSRGLLASLDGWKHGPVLLGLAWSAHVFLGLFMTMRGSHRHGGPLFEVLLLEPLRSVKRARRRAVSVIGLLGVVVVNGLWMCWIPSAVFLALVVDGLGPVLIGLAALTLIVTLLMVHGTKLERAARNPLRRPLEMHERSRDAHTSVIAVRIASPVR